MMKKLISTVCLGAVIASSTPNLEAFTASVKNFGMGATGVANPQDTLAGFYNPAGMAYICDRIDVGVFFIHDNDYSNMKNGAAASLNGRYNSNKAKNIAGPDLGINYVWDCGCMDVSLGLISYNKAYLKTSYDRIFTVFGRSKPGLEAIQQGLSPIIATTWDCFSFGLSLNIIEQRFSVSGIENFANSNFSAHPDAVSNKGYNYSTGVGVTLGAMWEALPCLRFGLVWESKTEMTKMKRYAGFLADGGRLNLPQKFAGGVCWAVTPCTNLTADVQWVGYSKVHSLGNRAPTTTADLVARKLGSRNGPGFGWKDQTIFRIGADYVIDCNWTVRAGYRYGRSPVRAHDTGVNFLTLENVESYLTTGLTYTTDCGVELSGFYGYGFRNTIKGNNPLSTSFGAGPLLVDTSQQQQAAGLSVGWYY